MKTSTKRYLTYALMLAAGGATVAGAMWARKRIAAQGPVGFVFPFTDVARIYDAATAQIEKAGTPLSDYRQAEDIALFWGGAATDQVAYAKAAYWVAVAARLEGNSTLATYARTLMDEANRFRLIPGSDSYTSNIQTIFGNARTALQPYSGHAGIRSIMGALGGSASVTSTAQQVQDDRSVFYNTAAKSGSDVASALAYTRGLVTGEKPPGYTDMAWFAHKWGGRAVAGLLVAGVGYGIWKWYGVGEKVSKVKHIAKSALSSARGVAVGEG